LFLYPCVKGEVFTKVAPVLFHHRLSIGFATGVRIVGIVKSAVETAVKICFTMGAGVPATGLIFKDKLSLTGVAEIHRFSS
jgi:hypothetical protein